MHEEQSVVYCVSGRLQSVADLFSSDRKYFSWNHLLQINLDDR